MKTTIVLLVISASIAVIHGDGHGGGWGDGHGDDHASYKFEYGVADPKTHDYHSQHEHRDGHHVTGAYELKEADGTKRIVKYKSGPKSGFEAVVERVGHASHPAHYGHGGGHGGHGGGHGGEGGHGGHGGGHGGTSYVAISQTHGGHGGGAGHGGDGGHGGHGGHDGYGHGH